MRIQHLALALVAGLALSSPAAAVLKHYNVRWTGIQDFNTSAFNKDPLGVQPDSGATIDTGGGSPVLKRLKLVLAQSTTTNVPALAGFIFRQQLVTEGPRKGLNFTGAGSTASTIAWGLVTGWTVTGGIWCHSSPSYICSYAAFSDLATIDPSLRSPLYDLGTWTFHGTGFTASPFIYFQGTPAMMTAGNAQYQLKGRISAGLIPALPVLGVALLGASLLFAGARFSRKR
jgi:hypothetical protein